jgi:hypothetical protein
VEDLVLATKSILEYLEEENPYLLTYRFGVPEGLAMQAGLNELLRILEWCSENDYEISITPIHRYYSQTKQKEITKTVQQHKQPWM